MSVKKIAGKILLSLYVIQIDDPFKLEQTSVVFKITSTNSNVKLDTKEWLREILHSIDSSDAMLCNAFNYLIQKNLISNKDKSGSGAIGCLILLGLHLTANGIDVIEGVEQGEESQKIIKSLFNFSFTPKVTIDSLVKAEVGNIVGVGVAANGKIEL